MLTVTLSAFRPEYSSIENAARQARMIEKMQRVGFELVSKNIGSYKGEREQSATFRHVKFNLGQVAAVASFFEQESILLEQNNVGYLIMMENSQVIDLGRRKSINENEAAQLEAWTMTQNGDFYTYL